MSATAVGGRKISRVVTPTRSGPVFRLVGTLDCDGAGTDHPLDNVDPFMLLDCGTISKDGHPTFGPHPHRGHSVVSIMMQGAVKSWDSYTKKETLVNAPASYWVDAGSGLFHDEMAVIPDETDPGNHVRMFQLWVSVREEDRLKPPSLQYDTDLPVVEAKDAETGESAGKVVYYVGGGGTIKPPHSIVVAQIRQDPGTRYRFPIEDARFGGFAVSIKGQPTFSGTSTPTGPNEVFVLADGSGNGGDDYLEVAAPPGADGVEYLVCVGEKIGESWSKKLVASGAVIAKTSGEAREIAAKVEGYAAAGKSPKGSFAPFGI
ncbi:hypothetical protein ACHAXT_012076 [Thalassiosira profunda]